MDRASLRLCLALTASLLLHAAVLGLGLPEAKVSARRTALQARLLPPAPVEPAQTLLKDTLAEPAPAAAPRQAAGAARARATRAPQAARRRLSEVLFYPPEAVARGLEGEVRLLLKLDEEGTVLEAQIAAGSGHPILDEAALRAAHALGRLPGAGGGELILPVVFRLR